MISLKQHNIIDYIAAATLFISPWLFGFADVVAARNAMMFAGIFVTAYSLLTRYPYSAVKWIPIRAHMPLDVVSGLFVIAAPWLFDYRAFISGGQTAVHTILGLAVIGLVILTRRTSQSVASVTSHSYERDRAA